MQELWKRGSITGVWKLEDRFDDDKTLPDLQKDDESHGRRVDR